MINMSLFNPNTFYLRHKPHFSSSYPSFSASLESGVALANKSNADNLLFEGSKERIRKLFDKVELSASSYDTAWVAMVPSPHHSGSPCFPGCVNWILDNQLYNGSWGLSEHSDPLLKDALSSTLACILALKKWGVGEQQINKGLHFLQLNFESVTDKNQPSPIGFDIIFPGMLEYAKTLDLKLPVEPKMLDDMLNKRSLALRRYSESYSLESESYLAYVSEGMGNLQNWKMIMKYQRKNGSLFNSPSTTAAALNHLQNSDCLNYLRSLLEKLGDSVPTVYPLDIYARLCMVDNLEKLGIDRHFRKEIRSVLDETYSCWVQEDEQIFMDVATCALAFRILRMNGYDVSSDTLTQIAKEKYYLNSLGEHLKDTSDTLELYKASQVIIHPNESALCKQNSWSSHFLKQKLSDNSVHSHRYAQYLFQEVEDALKFPPHANLERLVHKRNIETFNVDSTRILKTSYCSSNISNTDFLRLAAEDFNHCQSIQREEVKRLESWVVENKLDKLKFARQRTAYCFFSAAATIFPPEQTDARISWAKGGILTTVVDDFYDVGGSIEELVNLIQLVEKWNVNVETDCCSEQVRIIFLALRSTICEIGNQAFKYQERDVTRNITEIWLDLMKSMLRESQMAIDNSVPSLDEYMENGYVSFALGPIVLPALYLVGPKLSEDDVQKAELHNLYKLMSTCGRLLNDIQSFKRESKEGKLNSVSLHMIHGVDGMTEEEAVQEMKRSIDSKRRELLRLVLLEKGSVVPRACKDLFWKMSKVLHLFYANDDGFTSEHMIDAVKAVVYEPISFDYSCNKMLHST